ncbi:P-loop containing nucleoside triphosphate hydrolase protein, partial [Linderina pennispora]
MRIRAARWTRNVIPERQSTDKWKSKYAATQAALPACQYMQTIADALAGSQTVVIRGATGCGKTTQVPQIALRLLLSAKYKGGRILCTQPRRISATSISQRVSLEVGDGQLGTKDSLVGFQVRLNARAVDENPLVFCTTGVLLRMLVENPKLAGISCVICDEVQERTLELDYLLIVLRRLLARRPDLKVILMSATIDTSIFTYYFDSCPVVDIPGRTFPVTNMYLENVIQMSGYVLDSQSFFAERPKYV